MNEIKQRIAIAKACGWDEESARRGFKTVRREIDGVMCSQISDKLPDYLNDLNAIVQAVLGRFQTDENLLSVRPLNYEDDGDAVETRGKYERHLYRTLRRITPNGEGTLTDFDLANAPAPQRAEAFLRTLGLWEETPT